MIRDFMARVAGLSPDKRQLLAARNPLSFAQERTWLLAQLEPESPMYNVPGAVRLIGALDRAAFAAALAEVFRRHQALRTTFPALDGRPLAWVEERPAPALATLDLTAVPAGGRLDEARRAAQAMARRPFDLARGPLLSWALFDLESRERVFLLSLHHIVCDGWSIELLIAEIAEFYSAALLRRPPAVATSPIQYLDYARWQRQRLSAGLLERQLAYWREELAGLGPALELPFDRPRPAVRTMAGGRRFFQLAPTASARAAELATRWATTPFVFHLAAFGALLARLSRIDDVALGIPIANRDRLEMERLVGLFLNTPVLRVRTGEDPTFAELVARTAATVRNAMDHRELPFERLVDELRPERSLGTHPLFQVSFTLKSAAFRRPAPTPLAIEPVELELGAAKFDLTLSLVEQDGGFRGTFEWSADLFDPSSAIRWIDRYSTLLGSAVAAPDRCLSALSFLSPSEHHQLLREWSAAATAPEPVLSTAIRIAAQARQAPEAVAIVCGDRHLSYGELDRRADSLSGRLAELGVGRGEVVAIHTERSLEMVAALLAVRKAGAAYLPLDPGFPRERLTLMLKDSGANLRLTEDHLASRLVVPGVRTFLLDAAGFAPRPGPRRPNGGALDELAYLIYTSGSTGRPKGVEVGERSLAGFLTAMERAPGLARRDVLYAVTTLSFDIAALELLLPLVVGARLVIAVAEAAQDGERLKRELIEADATALQATPATWRLLLEAGWRGHGRTAVLCGGEALPRSLADALLAASGRNEIWNLYGPTEATVWATLSRVGFGTATVSVGRALPGVWVHLVDRSGNPAAAGAVGEILLGGRALAWGYRGRPELTAERFVPDPFSGESGARLYRTGDLGRFQADGELICLGRVDHQVKLRGYRIELGEIEAALVAQPGIRHAVVSLRDGVTGARLVAHVVVEEPALSNADLLAALRTSLPSYMLPSAIGTLKALPLTPNGKVDRRALPEVVETCSGGTSDSPRTPIEETLAEIWAEVLRLERVGAHDHFFELGGHSLLAARVVSRIREAFGIEVPLRHLFNAPTLEGLARVVEERLSAGDGAAPRIERQAADDPRFLSFAQERLWSIQVQEPQDTTYNLLKAVRLSGAVNPAALGLALAEVVRRHEVLRTRYLADRGRVVPVPSAQVPVLARLDLSGLVAPDRELELARLGRAELARPFDLAADAPLRLRLIRLAAGEHALLLSVHHIAADLWSLATILSEVSAAYAALVSGAAPELPELPLQYADFAAWQRLTATEEALSGPLDYWRRELADLPMPIVWQGSPRALSSAQNESGAGRGARLGFIVPAPIVAALRALARREAATLHMVLLAVFQALIFLRTGRSRFVVGTPTAGRRRVETERLVGFFLNTLPMVADLGGDPQIRELVHRVRRTALDAYAHQDVPLQRLLAAIGRRMPPFNVWFAFQNVTLEAPKIGNLVATAIDFGVTAVPFDLALLMQESGDVLAGSFEYRLEALAPEAVEEIAADFLGLLGAVGEGGDRRLSELMGDLAKSRENERQEVERDYALAIEQRFKSLRRRAAAGSLQP